MTVTILAPLAKIPIGKVTINGQAFAVPMEQEWLRYLTVDLVGGTVTHTGSLTQYAVVIGNAAGDVAALASIGTLGQVLTSNGVGAAPSFQTGGSAEPANHRLLGGI